MDSRGVLLMVSRRDAIKMSGISKAPQVIYSVLMTLVTREPLTPKQVWEQGFRWDKDGPYDHSRLTSRGRKAGTKRIRNMQCASTWSLIQTHLRGLVRKGGRHVLCYEKKMIFYEVGRVGRDGAQELYTATITDVTEAPRGSWYMYVRAEDPKRPQVRTPVDIHGHFTNKDIVLARRMTKKERAAV